MGTRVGYSVVICARLTASTPKSAEKQIRVSLRLAIVLCIIALLLAAGLIGLAVSRGASQAFDEAFLMALRVPGQPTVPNGPKWLPEVARDLTALGGVAVLTLLTVIVAFHLLLRRLWLSAALVLAAAISGTLISNVL